MRVTKYITTVLALVLLLISGTSNAVIIGGKDWRQVTDTTGYSWNDFDAIFDTSTGACDVVGCLLDNGASTVNLTGYTWANNFEVNDLLTSYSGVAGFSSLTSANSVDQGPGALDDFFNDFSATSTGTFNDQIAGRTRDQSIGNDRSHDLVSVLRWHGIADNFSDRTILTVGFRADRDLSIGGWVYKNVPEPSIIALFGLGLLGLGFSRRRKVQA